MILIPKSCVLLLFLALLILHPLQALAAVDVYVDGRQVNFDSAPVVDASSNRTLVPFRHIFEALGAKVWYESKAHSAIGKKDNLSIKLPINKNYAYLNNDKVSLDVATKVINGRTMVPLRFVGEAMGCTVYAQNIPTGLAVYITGTNSGQENELQSEDTSEDNIEAEPEESNNSKDPNVENEEKNTDYVEQEPPQVKDNLVVLDAGHGGSDSGAVGYSGRYEKDLVNKITQQVKIALEEEGYSVLLTRTGDSFVSLEDRVKIANQTTAFAFISIHANSFFNSSAKGLEVYTMYGSDHSLAQKVLEAILARTGQLNRKVKEAGFYVIKNTDMPSILIETGFISNPQEEAFLWKPENQNSIVEGIVEGIKNYHS